MTRATATGGGSRLALASSLVAVADASGRVRCGAAVGEHDGGAAAGVDAQLEDVGAAVVPDGVHVEVTAGDLGEVDLGVQDGFVLEHRAGEDRAVGGDDRAAASHQ